MNGPDDPPERLKNVPLAGMPLSMVIADPHQEDCPLIYVNRAFERTTGYSYQMAIGRNCRFLQGKDTAQAQRGHLREALARREPVSLDIRNYKADGTPFVNRLVIAPLYDDQDELIYFMGIQTERTHETEDERKVRELDAAIMEIQHRVKNHLSMILSMIRLEARNRDAHSMATVLVRRVGALTLLYEDFATGYDAARTERIKLDAYLSRVCSVVHQLDGRSEISLNMHFYPMEAALETASRLGLIVSEALTNAFQHAFNAMPDGGSIQVEFTRDDDSATLVVRDDGSGMVEGTWPKPDSMGGRIVQSLVDQLRGTLHVHTADGEGTRVTLTLPVEGLD